MSATVSNTMYPGLSLAAVEFLFMISPSVSTDLTLSIEGVDVVHSVNLFRNGSKRCSSSLFTLPDDVCRVKPCMRRGVALGMNTEFVLQDGPLDHIS